MAKRVNRWHTPNTLPEGTLCRPLFIPDSEEWLAAVSGALIPLTETWRWEHVGAVTPEQAAERMTRMLHEYYENECGDSPQPPFFDEQDGEDADGDDLSTGFPWYENLADWIVTAFLAVSFTPEAAIEFVTTARKLRLWFRTRDYGAIVRILLDGLEIGTVDTYADTPGMVEFAYDIPTASTSLFSAQAAEPVTLRVEHTGTANENAVATSDGYAIELIRKEISWTLPTEAEECPFRVRYNEDTDKFETSADGETWQEADYVDPRTTYQQPPVDTANPRCDAAARMVAELRSLIEAGIANVDNAGDVAGGIAAIAGGVALVVGANLLVALMAEIASAMLSLGAIALHNEFDDFDWHALQCEFYCVIDGDGRLNEGGFAKIVQYLNTLSLVQSALINLNMLLLGWGGLSDYAYLRSETGDCDECDECDWEHYIMPYDPNVREIAGMILNCSNVAIRNAADAEEHRTLNGVPVWGSLAMGGNLGLHIGMAFSVPGETTISEVVFKFARDGAGNTDQTIKRIAVNDAVYCGTTFIPNPMGVVGTWNNTYLYVDIAMFQGAQLYHFGVEWIRFRGTGRNPFL
jgi:hypothetical protein